MEEEGLQQQPQASEGSEAGDDQASEMVAIKKIML